jgi:hypothetical protein
VNYEGLVEAIGAGVTSAAVVGTALRSYWTRREARNQQAFRRAVQQIVDESLAGVHRRQIEAERRQGKHLDRQDETLKRLGTLIETIAHQDRPHS